MADLVILIITAEDWKPRANQGRIICLIDENPDAGKTFNLVEKIIISKSPDQKIGMARPTIPTAVIIESMIVFFFRAARTPKDIPITIAMRRAPPASLIVVGNTLKRASVTDLPDW